MGKTIFDARMLPLTLDVKQAADLMSMSEWHLRKLLRAGEIPAKKIGKGWLIPTSNALEYIGVQTTPA